MLFEPAVAYRSANGVVLSWWVGEGGGRAADAGLEVLGATGEVVGALEPAGGGEGREWWVGAALPVVGGVERVRWDLQTDATID